MTGSHAQSTGQSTCRMLIGHRRLRISAMIPPSLSSGSGNNPQRTGAFAWPLVVRADPDRPLAPSVREVDEVVLPNTLLFHAAEEPLDDPVLLSRVQGDEFLRE